MSRPAAPASTSPSGSGRRPSRLVALFLVSLALPLFFYLGPLRLSPYRFLLLLAVLPLFLGWLSDGTMKKRPCDGLMIFYVFWSGISMMVAMGPAEAIEPFGMQIIETFGAYFLARRYVRDAESYEYVVRWMLRIIMVLLPLALVESFTGREITLDIFRLFGPVFDISHIPDRWGFDRVQGPFEHPILFGVFCSSAIGMVTFLGAETRARLWRMWLVFFTGLWSLSSGPLSGIVMQMLTVGYERVTRNIRKRWNLIGFASVAAYFTVDMISNRTPAEVFISYVAFSQETAYNRILIWEYGSASVMKYPLFGLGVNPDFERPYWMSPSADMFWLLKSMQFGLPGGLAIVAAFLYITVRICREPITDARVNACRTGLLISLLGIFISGWTVHFWNATYVLVVFLFGAGVWMFEADRPRNRGGGPEAPSPDAPVTPDAPPKPRTIL